MPRALWKGAVSFGLVYIPVELYTAARSSSLDLDLLDKRDFSPVGYQRVNKRTGKVVEWRDIVKGYQYRKGQYVALSDEDFKRANVKATQTIEIVTFTDAANITPEYFEQPYYLAPAKGGAKVYALLREALKRTNKVGIAHFVMRGRQHMAALFPHKRALVLNTLRFGEEVSEPNQLDLPSESGKAVGLAPKELDMAVRLIEDMGGEWDPDRYHDTYREDLLKRIEEKVRKRQTHTLDTGEAPLKEPRKSAEVIDLMEVLKRSLEASGGAGGGKPPRRAPARQRASNRSRPKRTTRTRKRA
ncbi:MAG TPA: Ku protein [Steroidobacteraceae bacterium]